MPISLIWFACAVVGLLASAGARDPVESCVDWLFTRNATAISWDVFANDLQSGNVKSVRVFGDRLIGNFAAPPPSFPQGTTRFLTTVPSGWVDSAMMSWLIRTSPSTRVGVAANDVLLSRVILHIAIFLVVAVIPAILLSRFFRGRSFSISTRTMPPR